MENSPGKFQKAEKMRFRNIGKISKGEMDRVGAFAKFQKAKWNQLEPL